MTTTDFPTLAQRLRLPPEANTWQEGWDESATAWETAADGFRARLNPTAFAQSLASIPFSREIQSRLLAGLALFADPDLCQLLWHCHYRLFRSPGALQAKVNAWPLLPPDLSPHSQLFLVYPLLLGVPELRAQYHQRGIPDAILANTLIDIELWIHAHHTKNGHWGFSEHRWLIQHVAANLFAIGRLQYQFGTYRYPFTAWQQNSTGHIVVLAPADQTIVEGRFAEPEDAAPGWTTTYRRVHASIHGHPVSRVGTIEPAPVTLPLDDWQPVLEQGDPVLALHIPASGPLLPNACRESLAQALAFFPRHFPDHPFRAFACASWLLDPQLQTTLRPTANLVGFQRIFRLQPVPGASGQQTLARIFGSSNIDLATAPRDTSLRRAVLDHLAAGKRWRTAACLLFPADIAHLTHP
ncbi:MAG: DUF5596 domain-containing protein, partial [Victivallales bacterium]|nr:DUF5596 domain-containing protein [Victivallales bacterium]